MLDTCLFRYEEWQQYLNWTHYRIRYYNYKIDHSKKEFAMSIKTSRQIASIIGNLPLAKAIDNSISMALKNPKVHLVAGRTPWDVFTQSLDAAVLDVNRHPRYKLFRRLIAYGTCSPEESGWFTGNGTQELSAAESIVCIKFIFSHMVNRFKGELAELLAFEPCMSLIEKLSSQNRIPPDCELYLGDIIRQPVRNLQPYKKPGMFLRRTAPGADGLIISRSGKGNSERLDIHGIIEVKSMQQSLKEFSEQIGLHLERLAGGLKLKDVFTEGNRIRTVNPVAISITTSQWKVPRGHRSITDKNVRKILLSPPVASPVQTDFCEVEPDVWRITLSQSQEALEQAAYEMTYHFMAYIGECVFTEDAQNPRMEGMTPLEAGYNAIKEALYYLLRFDLPDDIKGQATKLYNVYGFGYANNEDSQGMLWADSLE